MTSLFDTITTFIGDLKSSELVLGLIGLILLIALLSTISKNLRLRDENGALQKDYAPRRKRVYQEYTNWLSDVYSPGVMDLTPDAQEALRMLSFDLTLWSSDRVIATLLELQKLLKSSDDIAPERFEKLMFQLLLSMRSDMGFSNKKMKWQKLREIVLLQR